MVGTSIFIVPASLLIDRPWTLAPTPIALISVVCLALGGTTLAYFIYFYLLKHTSATNVSLVAYLIPVSGVILGSLVLDEKLSWHAFVALGLILGGIASINKLNMKRIIHLIKTARRV